MQPKEVHRVDCPYQGVTVPYSTVRAVDAHRARVWAMPRQIRDVPSLTGRHVASRREDKHSDAAERHQSSKPRHCQASKQAL